VGKEINHIIYEG
jgi:hypothetical protein